MSFPIALTAGATRNSGGFSFGMIMAIVAAFGLLFQVGHFAEHAFQFTVWVLGDLSNICGRDTPWMSPWVTELVRKFGVAVLPAADSARQMMLGMELLHLLGNTIFLASLACLFYCVRSRWVRWALYIEGFHLYEHIMLTTTAYFIGKPIGLSTLFGGASIIGTREFAVGYRVTWHFLMNLLPMPFAMIGIMEYRRQLHEPNAFPRSQRATAGSASPGEGLGTSERHGDAVHP